jgi:hypothetical protein
MGGMELKFKSVEQRKKFYADIGDVADYYRKTKTTQRINLVITVIYNLLILLFIIGTIMSVINAGGIDTLFGDGQDLKRRFDCQSGGITDTVKSYSEAKDFVDMYNGTCKLYHANGGQ